MLVQSIACLCALALCAQASLGEDRYFGTQSDMAHGVYDDYGVPNLLVFANSSVFGAPQGVTLSGFIAASPTNIANNLSSLKGDLLDDLNITEAQFDARGGIIVMDIENDMSPMDWEDTLDGQINAIRAAFFAKWAQCIELTKDAFPGMEIAVWDVATPYNNGTASSVTSPSTVFAAQMATIVAAAGDGVFDDVDYLCPQLYIPWAPGDNPPGSWTVSDMYSRMADQALYHARTVLDSSNNGIKVMPVMKFTVSGDSYLTADPDLDETLYVAISELRNPTSSASPADAYAFWAPDDSSVGSSDGWADGDVPEDYWEVLYCKGDFDADNDVDMNDFIIFSGYYSASDIRADFNDDASVTYNDYIDMAKAVSDGCTSY